MGEMTVGARRNGIRHVLFLGVATALTAMTAGSSFAGDSIVSVVWLAQTQPAQETAPLPVDTSHPRAKLVLASNGLAGNIRLLEPRFRKLGAFTQAQVTIRNLSPDRYVLEYKFDWHDEDWFATGQKTVWHRFKLSPNQIETLQSMGKTPEASGIVLTVRFPEDATIK